jgi:type I restriction enzyme S subunit
LKWPVVSLSDALASAEVFVDGDWVESKDQDPEGDVRLVQLADVGDGEYIDKSDRFLTSVKARELRCTYLKPGDVMVARMPDPLGRACIFPGDSKPSVTVVDVCIIRPNEREHDARWLMHCLNAPACRNQIASFATGTTRSRISRSNLGKIKIALPPLAEQRRIANLLDRAEALRAKRRAAFTQVDSLTQSLFLNLFGDPTTNPKAWPTKHLNDLVRDDDTINYGVVQPGDNLEEGIPLVRVSDLLQGQVSHASLKRISPSIEAAYKRSRLRGDEVLLVCVGATAGVVALADETVRNFNIARAVARIPLADSSDRIFVAAYLRTDSAQRRLQNELRTVAQPTLNIKQIGELPIVHPPLELQREFARRVGAVEKLKTAQRASLAEMDALFASLQHRAFRREL